MALNSADRSVASSPGVSARMARVRRRDTVPELTLRRLLHAKGLRYRVDARPMESLRSRADIVFRPARVAVYVDGCFWHSCPIHGVTPKHNRSWWLEKLEANRVRDDATQRSLECAGWAVVRCWEHADMERTAALIDALVASRRVKSREVV